LCGVNFKLLQSNINAKLNRSFRCGSLTPSLFSTIACVFFFQILFLIDFVAIAYANSSAAFSTALYRGG
jgi:hypothetical protein